MPAAGNKLLWTAVAILVVWGLAGAARGAIVLPTPATNGKTDVSLYEAIVSRVTAGEDYYQVLATELPSRGYAIRPVFNWRLPTLTWINALPPSPQWGRTLLVVIGIAAIVLWCIAVRQSRPRAAMLAVPIVVFAIVPLIVVTPSLVFYEIWSGLLIASSIACLGLGWWRPGVAFGAAALAIRELALPFVIVMLAFAWLEKRREETLAWLAVLAVAGALWLWHLSHVLGAMPAEGLANGWIVGGGWPFVLKSAHSSVFVILSPAAVRAWLVAIAVPVLWAGLWHWRDATGRRLAWTLTIYFLLFMCAGRPDNWYWGFMISLLIPLGVFGFVPPGPRPRKRRK